MYSEQQVIDLLEDLRRERFRIGVEQHIQVQDLILALTASRGLPSPETLHRYLAPLLCKSPDEVARFSSLLQRWIERHANAWRTESSGRAAETGGPLGATQISVTTTISRRHPFLLGGLCVFVIGLIAIALMSYFQIGESLSESGLQPESFSANSFLGRLFNGSAVVVPWFLLVTLTVLALRAVVAFWRPGTTMIRRRFGQLPPAATELPLLANRASLTEWLRREVLQFTREQAVALGQQRSVEREILDIQATVNATARRGGCLDLRKRRMNQRPAYVLLMDQLHPQDQQFNWFMHWEAEFRREGLQVETFVFSGDPHICWRPGSSTALHLEQLAVQRVGDRLIIFSDGASLYDAVTGALQPWVRESELHRWRDRVLLTPLEPPDWGQREQKLAEAGFAVVPTTESGLAAMVQWLATGSARLEVRGGARRLPPRLADASPAWGETEPPDDVDQLHGLIGELRSYLGTNGFRWFAACAAFPVLRWEFVLDLGRILLGDQDAAVHVQSLVRLPWMRRGAMPDWFRLRLLNELSQTEQSEARSAAQLILDRTRTPGVEIPDLIFPVAPEAGVGDAKVPTGAAADFVSIGFVTGMSADQLTLCAPAHWRAAMAPEVRGGLAPTASHIVPQARARPSGSRVFLVGLLMTGSIGFPILGSFYFSLSLTWFLPLLAGWLAHRHGLRILRAWWPLAFLPSFGVTLGNIEISLGASTATLFLAIVIAAAVDSRIVSAPLVKWIRHGARSLAIGALCLLVVAALEPESWRAGSIRINLIATVPAILLLALIRWESLGSAIWPRLAAWPLTVLSFSGAAAIVSGLVISGTLTVSPFYIRVGSYSPGLFIAVVCFALAVFSWAPFRVIAGMLAAGLVADRLLALASGGSLEAMQLIDEWTQLPWDVLFGSLAAAAAGGVLGPFLRQGNFREPFARSLGALLLALLAIVVLTPLLRRGYVPSYGWTLWMAATIAFAAGVRWRERSLLFVPPLLQFLYVLAAAAAPAPMGDYESSALAMIGMISFPYAFCGAFFSRSRELSPLERVLSPSTGQPAQDALSVIDVSELANLIDRIDRSATWLSFAVAVAPFVVLWQLFELYGVRNFEQWLADAGGAQPMIYVGADYATAALLGYTAFGFALWFAFALWDWLERSDALRMLALVTGGVVGALVWQVIGVWVGLGISELLLPDYGSDEWLIGAGLSFVTLVLLGSGLLAGTDRGIVRAVFLASCGLATVMFVSLLVWLPVDFISPGLIVLSASIPIVLTTTLAGFVRVCLVLAGERRWELLFGTLRPDGFWGRVAAASGLPSACRRMVALKRSAFWALLTARFVVYIGGVFARTSIPLGAALLIVGHLIFHTGKRLSLREMWRPHSVSASDKPILYLCELDDDQCNLRRPAWNLLARWLDMWSFRKNLNEVMYELTQAGSVFAFDRPGDMRTNLNAAPHYASDSDWQSTLADAAQAARAIVLVASDSPRMKRAYQLLYEEGLRSKVLLLFPPDPNKSDANRNAAEWFCAGAGVAVDELMAADAHPIGIRKGNSGTILLHSRSADATAYVLALRVHFAERLTVT